MTSRKTCVSKNFNEECPICLDKDETMFTLKCKHRMHIDCAKGMLKLQCPLCRKKITTFPKEIKDKIRENEAASLREAIDEESRYLQHSMDAHNAILYIELNNFPRSIELVANATRVALANHSLVNGSIFDEIVKEIVCAYQTSEILENNEMFLGTNVEIQDLFVRMWNIL